MLYFWNTFNHFIIFVYIQVIFITIVEKKNETFHPSNKISYLKLKQWLKTVPQQIVELSEMLVLALANFDVPHKYFHHTNAMEDILKLFNKFTKQLMKQSTKVMEHLLIKSELESKIFKTSFNIS